MKHMAVKKNQKPVKAWRLSEDSPMKRQLLRDGKILAHADGTYELFSQEAGEIGQRGNPEDYFKVDSSGFPYPISKEWFENNHICLGDGLYRQKAVPRQIYRPGFEISEEIQFLLDKGLLTLHEEDPAHYFQKQEGDALLTQDKDATLVISGVQRDEEGNLTGVDFAFVAAKEFDLTYTLL